MYKKCPICSFRKRKLVSIVDVYKYYLCAGCGSIYISPDVINRIDIGEPLVEYTKEYWDEEIQSAKERAFGIALARMAEVFYYARRPINTFLDIGTGPGFFLDAVRVHLPVSSDKFYGVEKFPPPESLRSESTNYIIGDISSISFKIDAGMCVEVVEHLTPQMFKSLIEDLASVVSNDAIFIFNSGMPDYVLKEDSGYLDPLGRGHIISYSIEAIKILAQGTGFSVYPIPGKTWAFLLEYRPTKKNEKNGSLQERIWTALPHNLELLRDDDMGTVLQILGLETCRAYGC